MGTITQDQSDKITGFLGQHRLSPWMKSPRPYLALEKGDDGISSIAAINIALSEVQDLSGDFSDKIPDCMSEVVGRFIRYMNYPTPDGVRNSAEWKRLLTLSVGTGRGREKQRLDAAIEWMWDVITPTHIKPELEAFAVGLDRAVLREALRTASDEIKMLVMPPKKFKSLGRYISEGDYISAVLVAGACASPYVRDGRANPCDCLAAMIEA